MSRKPILDQPTIDRVLGRKPNLTEADVQRTCTDLLIADGWRAIRTDPVSDRGRGKGFGEIGMPDYLYIRYNPKAREKYGFHMSEVLWIEFKAPGKKPRPHQARWIAAERNRGALVWVVDDIDQFRKDYAASGLSRRVR